jgi:hypothetical protein
VSQLEIVRSGPKNQAGFHRRLEFLTESNIPAARTSKTPAITQLTPTNRNALAENARRANIHASHPNADKGPPCPVLPPPHRLLHCGRSAATIRATPKKRKNQPHEQLGSQLISSTMQTFVQFSTSHASLSLGLVRLITQPEFQNDALPSAIVT